MWSGSCCNGVQTNLVPRTCLRTMAEYKRHTKWIAWLSSALSSAIARISSMLGLGDRNEEKIHLVGCVPLSPSLSSLPAPGGVAPACLRVSRSQFCSFSPSGCLSLLLQCVTHSLFVSCLIVVMSRSLFLSLSLSVCFYHRYSLLPRFPFTPFSEESFDLVHFVVF